MQCPRDGGMSYPDRARRSGAFRKHVHLQGNPDRSMTMLSYHHTTTLPYHHIEKESIAPGGMSYRGRAGGSGAFGRQVKLRGSNIASHRVAHHAAALASVAAVLKEKKKKRGKKENKAMVETTRCKRLAQRWDTASRAVTPLQYMRYLCNALPAMQKSWYDLQPDRAQRVKKQCERSNQCDMCKR